MFPFSSTEKCDEALVTPLPHNAFTSSSVFTGGYAPGYAKLNKRGGNNIFLFFLMHAQIHAHKCDNLTGKIKQTLIVSLQHLNKHS